jgi:hypothetical protein
MPYTKSCCTELNCSRLLLLTLAALLCDSTGLLLQVTEETSSMRFNTGIAAMMEFVNGAYKWEQRPRQALEQFVLLLAPYAPHLAEEMWQVPPSYLSATRLSLVAQCRGPTALWDTKTSLSLQKRHFIMSI